MKKVKQIFSMALAIALMVALLVPTVYAADDTRPSSVNDPRYYEDVSGSWAATEMGIAIQNGILNGTSSTTATPNKLITRAEMAAFMVRVFEPAGYADISRFVDVSPYQWHYTTIAQAVSMGVLYGDGNMIRPDDTITKQEAAVILARAFNLYGYNVDLQQFADYGSIASWAYDAMRLCTAAGIVRANSQRQLLPTKEVTRAEFAYMLANAVTAYSSSRVYSVGTGSVKSVMVSDWEPVLRNVTVTDNVFIGDGVANSRIALNQVDVGGTFYAMNGSALNLTSSYISTLVLSSKQATNFSVNLDAESSIDTIVVLDAGTYVTISGDIGEIKIETETTEVDLSCCNVKTLSSTVRRPTVNLDDISVVEDNGIEGSTYYDSNAMGAIGLHVTDRSRYAIAGDVEFLGYNPVRLDAVYGLKATDFVEGLRLSQDKNGRVVVDCDFYDVFVRSDDRNRTVLLDGWYLPIRIKITDIQGDFTLSVNDNDQGSIPNSSEGETCVVNMLIPFDESNTTANIKLIPTRGSRYDTVDIDIVLDSTVRFRT